MTRGSSTKPSRWPWPRCRSRGRRRALSPRHRHRPVRRHTRHGPAPLIARDRVRLAAGTAARTGRPGTSVDVAIAVNNLQLWPDIPAALAELHRVLRPGGRLLLSTHERPTVEAAGFTSVRTWTWAPPSRSTPTAAPLSAVRGWALREADRLRTGTGRPM
ncbi:methyltransferase domain-containing protein [Streptomyces flaveolus]|uniref:class I SAM-dependent methyltransferase n=1 Tax=Streptomyces flaveolus TaxID=67297 RepID=UPI00341842BA